MSTLANHFKLNKKLNDSFVKPLLGKKHGKSKRKAWREYLAALSNKQSGEGQQ